LAGATLATLGINQQQVLQQARRYDRALAQSTPRKLALLVGINQYPDGIPSLRGCLTDVALQCQLLVHRYGFNPRDILVVGDRALSLPGQTTPLPPTRQNILEAFESHLIEQAQPGDVVVVHYSGHGSYVRDENGIDTFNGLNGTLVPSDARLNLSSQGTPSTDPLADVPVDDIMGKTLFLLSLALPTDNLTLVLDSCHAGGGTRGNAMIGALDLPGARPSEQELAYQARWMERLQLTPEALRSRRQQGIAKGVALGSTQIGQSAAEVPFNGFHAGAFTYLLTRYLWQLPTSQPLSEAFVNIARSTQDVANTSGVLQDPVYATAPDRQGASHPSYFLSPVRSPAEAVIWDSEGAQVRFWLGGLSTNSLAAQEATFTLMDDRGQPVGTVVQTSRRGLIGLGRVQPGSPQAPQPGQLLREQIRGLPLQLTLRVGVTPTLEAAAPSILAQLNEMARIDGVAVSPTQPVDYLLGRLTESLQRRSLQRSGAIAAPPNSLGLFTASLIPVPDTFGAADETAAAAIARLRPRLKMLLASKMLSTLVNGSASDLAVEITLMAVAGQTPLLSLGSRSAYETGHVPLVIANSARVAAGTEIQVQVQNHESQDCFVSILSIASTGEIAILHPVVWDAPEDAARIGARQTVRVPDPRAGGDRFRFVAQGPAGFFELMVLVSADPLRTALRSLQTIARGRGTRSGNPLAFTEGARGADESEDAPLTVVDALLHDLDQGARGIGVVGTAAASRSQQVDAQRLAAFSVMIEVVD
jgi:hypothetical protein